MPDVSAGPVLLVDDAASIRDFITRQLEYAGFQTIQAHDGIDALVKLRDTLSKVIITDLDMPRMSGIEFIGIVRHRFPHIRIVALSGVFPTEFSDDIKPDLCFEKSMLELPELLQALKYLTQTTPRPVDLPHVTNFPVRAEPGSAGYLKLTCTDCLRKFTPTSTPGNEAMRATAVCTHCGARVPFLIEISETRPIGRK